MTEDSGDSSTRSYSAAEGNKRRRYQARENARNGGLHRGGARSEEIDLDNLERAVQQEEDENGKIELKVD